MQFIKKNPRILMYIPGLLLVLLTTVMDVIFLVIFLGTENLICIDRADKNIAIFFIFSNLVSVLFMAEVNIQAIARHLNKMKMGEQ